MATRKSQLSKRPFSAYSPVDSLAATVQKTDWVISSAMSLPIIHPSASPLDGPPPSLDRARAYTRRAYKPTRDRHAASDPSAALRSS